MPYQLHCEPPCVGALELDRLLIGVLLEETGAVLEATLEDATELADETGLADEAVPPPLQTLPVTAGRSVEPPFLLT